jgi:hypothetical protein
MIPELFKFYSIILLSRWIISSDLIVLWLAAVYLIVGILMRQNNRNQGFVLNYLVLIKSAVYFGDKSFADNFDNLDSFVKFDIGLHMAMTAVIAASAFLRFFCKQKIEVEEIIVKPAMEDDIDDNDNIWARQRRHNRHKIAQNANVRVSVPL